MNSNYKLNQNKVALRNNNNNYSIIKNINCKYILELIFKNLSFKKSLLIMKRNKDIQNKLNITIKDYIEYSDIVVELIPAKNKFGKFINIPIGEDESNFHIYFNESKTEIKRTNFFSIDNTTKIKIIIKKNVKSFYGLFEGIDCIMSISFKKFYRTNIINMSRMFFMCSALKNVELSEFITNNVTDMSCMFAGCKNLKKIDISIFNFDELKDMSMMFCGCSSLKYIYINKDNFYSKIKEVNKVDMLQGCNKLEI